MKAMVFRRIGAALLTRAEILSEIRSGRIVFLPLSDKEIESSSLSLITLSRPSSAAGRVVGDIVRAMNEMTERDVL